MNPKLWINPRTMWACSPGEQTRMKYIEGMGIPAKLPEMDDIVTVPFIVDPETLEPIPVRVIEIQERMGPTGHILVVVVSRADLPQ